MAIVSDKTNNSSTSIRPTILCGLNIKCRNSQKYQYPVIDTMEISQPSTTISNVSCLYIVVYDFMYSKDKENTEVNKSDVAALSNITTSTTPAPPSKDSTQDENQKNYIHADFLDQLTSIYKTLIPGESDEVFLPPPIFVKKTPHSGPRVLSMDTDMGLTETDAAQTEPFIINQDFSFMNGQLSNMISETFEKSISDHITDLKNNKSIKKLNYSRAVQCIGLPSQYKHRIDLDILEILTTQDGRHILVVLKSFSKDKSVLLTYALDFSQKMVKVHEEAILIRELNNNEKPIEVTMLPLIDKLGGDHFSDNSKHKVLGNIIMVCLDGAVRIVELATMKTICIAQLESEKFISAAYCNSKFTSIFINTYSANYNL